MEIVCSEQSLKLRNVERDCHPIIIVDVCMSQRMIIFVYACCCLTFQNVSVLSGVDGTGPPTPDRPRRSAGASPAGGRAACRERRIGDCKIGAGQGGPILHHGTEPQRSLRMCAKRWRTEPARVSSIKFARTKEGSCILLLSICTSRELLGSEG